MSEKKQLRKPKFKYIITSEVLEENSMNEFAIAQNYLLQIDEAISLTNRVDVA